MEQSEDFEDAVFKSTGEEVAIKTQIEEISEEAIEKEIEALTTLGKHTNVITLHGVMKDVENKQVYFVIDLMDLSLEETLNRMTSLGVRFREDEVKSVWLQCLRGLRHIHMAGLVHGDLAARNVLLSRTGIVKISDFGMAVRGDGEVDSTQRDDLVDLSVVFVYTVTQEVVEDLQGLENRVSSAGVELVEDMFYGEVSTHEALLSRYFGEEPSPRMPYIGHILSGNTSDPDEEMNIC
ncbi:cyclin-dependent kinase 11.2-like [Oratosquilla oratoria]|uniref:cyclin-dependent kinase 11.2-like n=1 Tax=Oratosquilla oratoria TaxID=337810 RepID=UPI003F7646D9